MVANLKLADDSNHCRPLLRKQILESDDETKRIELNIIINKIKVICKEDPGLSLEIIEEHIYLG